MYKIHLLIDMPSWIDENANPDDAFNELETLAKQGEMIQPCVDDNMEMLAKHFGIDCMKYIYLIWVNDQYIICSCDEDAMKYKTAGCSSANNTGCENLDEIYEIINKLEDK